MEEKCGENLLVIRAILTDIWPGWVMVGIQILSWASHPPGNGNLANESVNFRH